MFKKKEHGFSLVELSVAAAVAIGLAIVAVTVVSGTASSVSSKGVSAASVESCTISEALAKSGGDEAASDCGAGGNVDNGPAFSPVTILPVDFVSSANNWFGSQAGSMWGLKNLPVGTQSVSSWNELYESYTEPYKTIQFMGISKAKADEILTAFSLGATKVTTGGKDYTPILRKSIDYANRETQSGPGTIYYDIIRHYGPASGGGWRLELWVDPSVNVSYHNPPLEIVVN